jgi:hypothetical protein
MIFVSMDKIAVVVRPVVREKSPVNIVSVVARPVMSEMVNTCTMVVMLKTMSLEAMAIQRDRVSIMMSSVTKVDMKVVMRVATAT